MSILDKLAEPERSLLGSLGRSVRFEDKAEIISHHDQGTDVYLVVEGSAIATIISSEGRFIAYRSIGPGDIFGELAALTGKVRNAWVHARGRTRLRVIAFAEFERLLLDHPKIALALSRHLAGMVADLSERVFERSALAVRQRIGRELVRRADGRGDGVRLENLPSHAELAAFVGTHREAITKELSAFARDGLIVKEGRAIQIPSIDALLSALADDGDWT